MKSEINSELSSEFLTHCILCGADVDRRRKEAQRDLNAVVSKLLKREQAGRRLGENGHYPKADRIAYEIFRCKGCDLRFVNPRDHVETILKQYLQDETSPARYYLQTAKTDAIQFNKRLSWIEPLVAKGKLLDIGCNVGTFMETARDRGWTVAGIEPNEKALGVCIAKRLIVYGGFLSPELVASMEGELYDLACLNDSIEHLPNPLEALRLTGQLIRPQGHIAINTPNVKSILTKIFQIKPKEHLFYFDEKTLRSLLRRAGFEVVLLKEIGRRRDIGSMHHGATFDSRVWPRLAKILDVTGLDWTASFLLEHLFNDELFVLAQKR